MKPLLIRSAFHLLLKYAGNTVAIRIGVELGGIDARAVRRDQRIPLRLALQPEADIGDAVVLNETAVIELPVLVRTGSLAQDRLRIPAGIHEIFLLRRAPAAVVGQVFSKIAAVRRRRPGGRTSR